MCPLRNTLLEIKVVTIQNFHIFAHNSRCASIIVYYSHTFLKCSVWWHSYFHYIYHFWWNFVKVVNIETASTRCNTGFHMVALFPLCQFEDETHSTESVMHATILSVNHMPMIDMGGSKLKKKCATKQKWALHLLLFSLFMILKKFQ